MEMLTAQDSRQIDIFQFKKARVLKKEINK